MAGGRPTRFKQEYIELAFNYCLLGAKDKELAEFFGVYEQTINNWKKAHPKFLESIKAGKQESDANVANSLYHRANGYKTTETKVLVIDGQVVTHDIVKHHPPDTSSMIFWLKNRQPKLWRDKQDINHESEDGSMTPQTWVINPVTNKDD